MSIIFLIIIFLIILFLVYFEIQYKNRITKEIEQFDLCHLNKKVENEASTISSQTYQTLITGFDNNNKPIEEEFLYNNYCAGENQPCLVDSVGKSTCCGSLKCIRKQNNYHNYICSAYEKTACGRNTFICEFNLLFDDLWNKWLKKITFDPNINWNWNYINNLKLRLKNELQGLCGSGKMSEKEKINLINFNLNQIVLEDLVFAKPIRSISYKV
jgi:hypothetical protein